VLVLPLRFSFAVVSIRAKQTARRPSRFAHFEELGQLTHAH
jgi:hypothetical protein